MKKRIIIATHASLSKGFASSMEILFKPEDPIYTICAFTESMDPAEDFIKLVDSFDPEDKIVVLTDIVGGSVNQMIAKKLEDRKFYLISGVTLGMVLQLVCIPVESIDDVCLRNIVEESKNGIVFMNDVLRQVATTEEEDGFFG